MNVFAALNAINSSKGLVSVGAGVIKYDKNTFTTRNNNNKKSVRIIYAICNPGRGVGVFWSLLQRFTEYRKVRGRESLKLTEGGLGLRPQIRRDLRRTGYLLRTALGSRPGCERLYRRPEREWGGQRPGPKPAPDRRGPAPLRGLRKLRPLEVSRQPPDLLPGVRHHCLARTDTGKRQTRQPSALPPAPRDGPR